MDVVVTCPQRLWREWISEGDLPGQTWSGDEYAFWISSTNPPQIERGERVYVVALGQLRGYAPLVQLYRGAEGCALIRQGGAVSVTLADPIQGFRGWRYRWWERDQEIPYDFSLGTTPEKRQAVLL